MQPRGTPTQAAECHIIQEKLSTLDRPRGTPHGLRAAENRVRCHAPPHFRERLPNSDLSLESDDADCWSAADLMCASSP